MRKILLAIGLTAGVALVVAGVIYVTLVAATYEGEACTWDLDLQEVRALAASIPGDRATEIRVEHVSSSELPRAIACAGGPWEAAAFRVYAYQLVFPGETIVIDTAMDRSQAADVGSTEGYEDAAWQRVAAGLSQASAVYVTHEHIDHMGGAFADERWAPALRLWTRQLDSDTSTQPAISAAARAAARSLDYERYLAVAPGVVLIAASGHTPGSQMVYVSRADGSEVILTGDAAWLAENIAQQRGPAKLVTLLMGSDRNEQACQVAALHRIARRAPDVAMMPGHDRARMDALVERRVFVPGFMTVRP